jgi:CO/xanthine dehydrogenase FAD-binding subunit
MKENAEGYRQIDSFGFMTPGSIPELIGVMGQATPESKLLAGGTDLVIALQGRRCRPDLVIDLSGVEELRYIRLEQGAVHIGALTTFTAIAESPVIREYAPCLAEAAGGVGSTQIRNSGTIGGNVANASPAGDSIPVLLALGAVARVLDKDGQVAELSIDQLISGSGRTALRCDQVIAEFAFPALSGGYRSTFVKLGSRTAVSIAKLNMAVVIGYDQAGGVISEARVGLGAIGTKAFREEGAEELLQGKAADERLRLAFADELSQAVERAIPGRYSLPYKREAIRGLADDAWTRLFSG